jgi:hypothetical protein
MSDDLGKKLLTAQRELTKLQTRKQAETRPAQKAEIQKLIDDQHQYIRSIKKQIDSL